MVQWLSTYGAPTESPAETGDGQAVSAARNETIGHPGAGQPSLQDVKLRLVHHAKGLMAHFNNL